MIINIQPIFSVFQAEKIALICPHNFFNVIFSIQMYETREEAIATRMIIIDTLLALKMFIVLSKILNFVNLNDMNLLILKW